MHVSVSCVLQSCIRALRANKDEIQIEIEDKGPGVREQDLKFMFHPFNRLEHENSTQIKGYGLGLAIAKEMIEMHHGTIRAENCLNAGLRVIITLPVHSA